MTVDAYYTPPEIADQLADIAPTASVVLDPACGDGSLLFAYERQKGRTGVMGIDVDRAAVRRLRSLRPGWRVRVGDVFSPSVSQLSAMAPDAVMLVNPPFSRPRGVRGVQSEFAGQAAYCSASMAFLRRALAVFRPKVTVALLPESTLYSELDSAAWAHLKEHFALTPVAGTSPYAFEGARARGAIVVLAASSPASTPECADAPQQRKRSARQVLLIRGGLPMFQAKRTRGAGAALVHTTDLDHVISSGIGGLPRVKPLGRGMASGHLILLPRVGYPRCEQLVPLYLDREVQLSDCVFAVRCADAKTASRFSLKLRRAFDTLRSAYKGTGAPYTTCNRLAAALESCVANKWRVDLHQPEAVRGR